jgi:hypothetical protein
MCHGSEGLQKSGAVVCCVVQTMWCISGLHHAVLTRLGRIVCLRALQVRKALDMIKKLAVAAQTAKKRLAAEDGDTAASKKADDSADDDADEAPFDREALEGDVTKYETLWNEFGRALKLGARRIPLSTSACACDALERFAQSNTALSHIPRRGG